jgi:hypothetical protein
MPTEERGSQPRVDALDRDGDLPGPAELTDTRHDGPCASTGPLSLRCMGPRFLHRQFDASSAQSDLFGSVPLGNWLNHAQPPDHASDD